MKELILLEQFILSRQATNAEHQQALKWLGDIQKKIMELGKTSEHISETDG